MNESNSQQATQTSEKASAGKIVLWTFLFQVAWHFRSIIPFLKEGSFKDSDDFLRLHEIRNWMGGQGWFDVSVPRMNLPDGGDMHWSRLVDVPIAALIWFFNLFTDTVIAERLAAIVWPFILLLATVFTILAVCEKLYPKTNPLLALLFTVTCITALVEFAPSRIDHHSFQILFFSLTLLGLVNAEQRWGHYLVGAATVFSLVIGLDVLLLQIFILAWLGIEWVFSIDREGKGLFRTGVGIILTLLLLYPVSISPSQWLVAKCDAISSVYFVGLVLISISFFAMAWLTEALNFEDKTKTIITRLAVGAVFAGISLALILLLYPQCSGGPMSVMSEELKVEWLSKVVEAKGLIEYVTVVDPSWIGIPLHLLLIIAIGIYLLRKENTNPRLLALLVILVICFFLGLYQVRTYRIGIFATVPFCVIIAQQAWEQFSKRYENNRPMALAVTGALCLFLFSPVWLSIGKLISWPFVEEAALSASVHANQTMSKTSNEASAAKQCQNKSQYAFLNSLPTGNVMNSINQGPAILIFTNHSVVGGNYHRNSQAILDIQHFFAGDEETALKIATKRDIDYVVLCKIDPEKDLSELDAKTVGNLISNGSPPKWLKLLSKPDERLSVLKFVPQP